MPQRQGSDMKKHINVFGVKVPVKYFNDSKSDEHKELMGYCEKSPIAIYINKSLSKEDQINTMYHECIHAIFFRLGLDQNLSYEMQEMLCESIGNFMNEEMCFKRKK